MNNLSIVIIITSVCIYISGWENEIEKLFLLWFCFSYLCSSFLFILQILKGQHFQEYVETSELDENAMNDSGLVLEQVNVIYKTTAYCVRE